MNVKEKIKQLPKIDLHCHLSGSIRPETILDIAMKEGIEVPTKDLDEFKKYVQVPKNCRSLKEYLTRFKLTLRVMQKPKYLYRITDELLKDLSEQNVKYIEVRFAPFFHMEGGMSFEETVESVISAMDDGKKKYGIIAKALLICMRHHPPENSLQVAEKGKKYLSRGVVGIDMAGNEHDFPPEIHKEAFQLANKYGFHRTVHAGETGIPENIITAIEELYAERIGHGVHAYMNKDIFQYVKENRVPLEMCISSNVQTKAVESYKSHPIKNYLNHGIPVTVNTDNTTVSNTTLEEEYSILMEEQGFTLDDIKKVIMNSVDVSFTTDEEKKKLKSLFNEKFQNL
jgi:adenosine deaminase